ncbi:MAG: c-type cytochrome [Vicinamibacterales bacterium]|nr:c-type cytochrome [Vicinamibacterales bacterium]
MSSRLSFQMGLIGLMAAAYVVTDARPAAAQGYDGAGQFRVYCAVCHGDGGTGNGPLAESMRVKPADLTAITRNNKGTFPTNDVFRMIDGRNPVKGHGGPDMPVWGDAFARSGQDASPDAVRGRIEALVRYLERLQKP